MPTSIVAAVIAGAIEGSIAAGVLAFSWGAFATTLVLGALSNAMAKKPQQPGASAISAQGRMVTIKQPVAPRQIAVGRARIGGTITFAEVVSVGGSNNNVLLLVITLTGHVVEDITDVYFDDELVPFNPATGDVTGKYANSVRIFPSLGAESGQPFPALVAMSAGQWTDAHRQTGCAKIFVQLGYYNDLYPSGIPNITAVVKGAKIYDTRTGLTAWSANPALWVSHYLTDGDYGLQSVYTDEIDDADLLAAANICDEAVSLAAGGTEPRYEVNGAFLTSEKPQDIIERLLGAMLGKAMSVGARWHIYAGAYSAPTLTFDEGDLAGPLRIQSLVSRRDSCNGVKGIFTDPDSHWQPTDFPAIVSSAYLDEDGGERIWRDLDLSGFVTSGTQAQRIGKMELLRTRQPLTFTAPFKLTAWRAMTGRTLALDNTKYGWSGKVFEVMSSRFVVNAGDGGNATLNVELGLRETSSTIYDWSASEEQTVDIAPNTNLPDAFTVVAPGAPTVLEALYETTGSAGVKSRATVTWAASASAFAEFYQLEYKLSSVSSYTCLPITKALSVDLDDLAPDIYNFRVLAINTFGVKSDYSPVTTKQLVGLTAPPDDVAGFSVIKSAGVGQAQWTLHADLDVRQGGAIVVRHSPLTSGAGWNDGYVVEEFSGLAVAGAVPLITGTYMAKARDSTGHYSTNMVSFVATEGLVTGYTTVATSTQHPTFTGAKTNTAVVDSALQLDSASLIDAMVTSIDDWPYIDSIGGVSGTGSYDFDTYVDLGSSTTRRFEADIATLSFDTGDFIDARTDLIDSWGLFDGSVIDDCDVTLYAATTDDDPSGAPTWSAWTPFFVADFTCRAAKFKLDYLSGSAVHNIKVSTLKVDLKIPT